MRNLFVIAVLLLFSNTSFSQTSSSEADELRQEGKLDAAIKAYKKIYNESPEKADNTYNLACAYALTFQKDSAYHYLEIALRDDPSLWALADTDLYGLVDDSRWKKIENGQIEKFQKEKGKLAQPEYARELLKIIMQDQALDYYIDQAKRFYTEQGYIPQWYYPLGEMKKKIGEDNFENLKELMEKYGWPKYSNVGKLAADAPLLVINHHESDSVRKEYLPVIKQSCLDGEGSCMEYAKVQDRILVNNNEPQIYGMQFRYNSERNLEPFPILDPEHVDKRRKEIGLEPLKDYLKRKIGYDFQVIQED